MFVCCWLLATKHANGDHLNRWPTAQDPPPQPLDEYLNKGMIAILVEIRQS